MHGLRKSLKRYGVHLAAIVILVVVSLGVAGYILSNQRLYLPAWVPVVGTDFYVVNARVRERTGRHARSGPDRQHRRRSRGRDRQRHAQERRRKRRAEDPSRSLADLQGRDDVAASEDSAVGHVHRHEAGHAEGWRDQGRRNRSAREHEADRQLRRVPLRARRGHARLPPEPPDRRRPGSRRSGEQPAPGLQAIPDDRQVRHADRQASSRRATRTSSARSPILRCLPRRSATTRRFSLR